MVLRASPALVLSTALACGDLVRSPIVAEGDDHGSSATVGTTDQPRLDLGPGGTAGADEGCAPSGCGCEAVDLLFVIDNSVSMGDYQNALGLAFPQFAQAMIEVLPNGTSVRVGVTSTEMGYASGGSTTNCTSTGDGRPMDELYVTPDAADSGKNGAQGRLYVPPDQPPFYELATGDSAGLDGLLAWFSAAVAIGEGGSNVEMSAATAGWAADPLNNAPVGPNRGFIRNRGAVLVLFFVQDEPDQTPWTIDGLTGGRAMLDKIAAAKSECGGLGCVVGGGFVDRFCLPMVPLGELLDGLAEPAVVADLPDETLAEDEPAAAADQMAELMRDTLTAVIAAKCREIPPAG